MAILDLLDDILLSLLTLLFHNDLVGFVRSTSTCPALDELAQTPPFYKSLDFFYNFLSWHHQGPSSVFVQTCLQHDNTSCLLLKGMSEFIYNDRRDTGEALIKKLAETGWDTGVYVYSILVRVMYVASEVGSRGIALTREFSQKMRLKVAARDRKVWTKKPSDIFLEREGLLDLEKLWSCKCGTNNKCCYWWMDGWKSPDMGDDCFWTLEAHTFCEFVKHNFSDWL